MDEKYQETVRGPQPPPPIAPGAFPPRTGEAAEEQRSGVALTEEQLAVLEAAAPIQTVSWKKVDHSKESVEGPEHWLDALASLPARHSMLEGAAEETADQEPRTEGPDPAESPTLTQRAFPEEAEDEAEGIASRPGEEEAVAGADTETRPTREELIKGGTARLPVFRTLHSQELLAISEADFILRERIGRGGQGEVWRAWQASLARQVAIKRLIPQRGDVVEFLKEAYTSAELDHPNIVPVYDLGRVTEFGQEQPLLAMKMLRGRPWDDLMYRERESPDFHLDEYLARHLPILIQVTNAVAYAHSKGIIHRDLKPQQVVLGEYGEVFLIDWGLAVCLREDVPTAVRDGIPKHNTLRTASACSGTPAYMAPEQTLPTTKHLGYHTDIYLLGGILYELVSGQPPHHGDSARDAFFMAALNEVHPIPENCPDELRGLIDSCLAGEPVKRPASAEVFRKSLEDYLTGAGKRRESEALTDSVASEMAEGAGDYRRYSDWLGRVTRAQALWSENPRVDFLHDEALRRFARSALSSGDLKLARVQADRLPDGDDRDALRAEIDECERRARRHRVQRKILLYATIVLFAIGASMGIVAQRQAALAEQRAGAAEYGSYLSNVQFAQLMLNDGRVETAQEYLVNTPEALRHWEWGYLLRRTQMETAAFPRFTSPTTDAAFSPDGATLAVAFADGTVRLLDARRGVERGLLRMEGGAVRRIAFESDAGHLLTASEDGTIRQWNVGSRVRLREFAAGADRGAVAFGPAGERVATAGEGRVRLLEIESGESLELSGPDPGRISIDQLAVGPGGTRAAAALADGRLRLWRTAEPGDPLEIQAHARPMRALAFHPFRPILATAGEDDTARLWNAETGRELAVLRGHTSDVNAVAFHPEGDLVATGSSDGTFRYWDVATGLPTASLSGHAGHVTTLAFDARGEKLVTAGSDMTVKSWNAFLTQKFAVLAGHTAAVNAADFSPDRNRVLAASDDGTARLWQADTRREIAVLRGHKGPVLSADFGPDGNLVGTGGADGTVRLWQAISGDEKIVHEEHEGPVHSVRFAPDGQTLVSASGDGTLRLWSLARRRETGLFEGHTGPVRHASFDAEGERLVSASNDATARIWEVEGRQQLHRLEGHRGGVLSAAFSPDGKRVATGGEDATIRLWDARTGDEVMVIEGHRGDVNDVRFSADGMRLVSASSDRTAKVWDAVTGRELVTLGGHLGAVTSAGFSRDMQQVLTSSADWTVMVWDAAPY